MYRDRALPSDLEFRRTEHYITFEMCRDRPLPNNTECTGNENYVILNLQGQNIFKLSEIKVILFEVCKRFIVTSLISEISLVYL